MTDIVFIFVIAIVGLIVLRFSWINGKNVHTLTNYYSSGTDAKQIYNKTVNYFARNSSKLKLVKANLDNDFYEPSVTIKYKSLDGKTIFTFDQLSDFN